jgi:putative solute:sodium symporter small subunit
MMAELCKTLALAAQALLGLARVQLRFPERVSTGAAVRDCGALHNGEVTLAKLSQEAMEQHWSKTRSLTILIMVLWVIFGVLIPYFVVPLNTITFLSFPLGYWFCVQGSLLAFLAMIIFQNWRQDKIDDEFGVGE